MAWHSKLLQVDPDVPGSWTGYQVEQPTPLEYSIVAPRAVNSTREKVGNICWVQHLGVTNRERLYQQICSSILKSASTVSAPREEVPKIPFELIKIYPDGRCGWRQFVHVVGVAVCHDGTYMRKLVERLPQHVISRSILCVQDLPGFRSIARTFHGCRFFVLCAHQTPCINNRRKYVFT